MAAISRKTSTADQPEVAHERLSALINSMSDGVIAVDEAGRIAAYNGAALNLLNQNAVLDHKKIEDVLKLKDKHSKNAPVLELIRSATKPVSSREYSLSYTDGSIINLYLNIAPVRLGFGRKGSRGHVLLLRDITREKSLEDERDEFISVVSHELRTPVTIAEGNISNALLIAGKTGNLELIRHALKSAHEQVIFLSGLINDLATLSRAERGKLTLEIEPINASDLLSDLRASYEPDAKVKGLWFNIQPSPELEMFKSCKLYVREILQNFITNAIKYTEKGGITLGASPVKDGIEFVVEDTGIGISKSDLDKVWDKFFRSEDYRTRQNSGTGLGLYVTMKLAHLLHAQVDAESELNKGSRFTILIPNLE